MEWWKEPFFQVTLPLMVTFVAMIRYHFQALNKRVDDVIRNLDEIIRQLQLVKVK